MVQPSPFVVYTVCASLPNEDFIITEYTGDVVIEQTDVGDRSLH